MECEIGLPENELLAGDVKRASFMFEKEFSELFVYKVRLAFM